MSALAKWDSEAAPAPKRFVNVSGAAEIAGCHPETVREAARTGVLHGAQRLRIDPKTGRSRFKGGTWTFQVSCLHSWIEGSECEHAGSVPPAPVALAGFRGRNR